MMMMCRTDGAFNQNPAKSKLFTADLSQVYCSRSMVDEFSSKGNKIQAFARDDKKLRLCPSLLMNGRRHSVCCTEVVSRLDVSNASSITEDSTANSSDPAISQRRPATHLPDRNNMRHCEQPSEVVAKLDTSNASSITEPEMSSASTYSSSPSRTFRRKSRPLHKCVSMNQSISSIIRPSRYSSSNTSSVNSSRISSPSEGLDSSSSPPPSRRTSLDGWIASGVTFSSSVEVHVYRN